MEAGGSLVISRPSKNTPPEVGSTKRRMERPTVVLPEPDSPTRPITSPGWMVNDTSSTALTVVGWRDKSPDLETKCLVRWRTASNGKGSVEGIAVAGDVIGPPRRLEKFAANGSSAPCDHCRGLRASGALKCRAALCGGSGDEKRNRQEHSADWVRCRR